MDTRQECIDILSRILKTINRNCQNISFCEGERFSYLPSIDIDSGVISFPVLQEALFILYELDDGERICIFFFILLMIENDDYAYCDELLTLLENKGIPTCTDAKALHNSILIKQLFTILHECGHYYNADDNQMRNIVYVLFKTIGNELSKKPHIEENAIEDSITRMSLLNPNCTDLLRGVLSNMDLAVNHNSFINNSENIEEAAADLFAVMTLYSYFESDDTCLEKIGFKKSILESVHSINNIVVLKEIIRLVDIYGDSIANYLSDSSCGFYISLHRFYLLGWLVDAIFDEVEIDNAELYFTLFAKTQIIIINNVEIISKYCDAWIEGNMNETDSDKREVLYQRIINYTEKLKELYNAT